MPGIALGARDSTVAPDMVPAFKELKSNEGHRQVSRPFQFRVVRRSAACLSGAPHSRGSWYLVSTS